MKIMSRDLQEEKKPMFNLQFFADGEDGGGEDDKGGAGDDKGKDDKGDDKGKKEDKKEKMFTQSDVDRIVADRVAREKKKQDSDKKEEKKPMGDSNPGEKDQDTGVNDEAIQAAEAKMQVANALIIQSTAVTEAVKLGIDPQFTADAVRLADLSEVEVDEIGNVDASAVSKALSEVLKRMPMLKAQSSEGKGFQKIGADGGNDKTKNPWNKGKEQENGNSNTKRWNKFNR